MPRRKRGTASSTPLRTSKRSRTTPARTPQIIVTKKPPPQRRKAVRLAKSPAPSPKEVAEREREELVAAIVEAKKELVEEQARLHGAPRRDAELYLLDPYLYDATGEGEPVEVSSDDMIVCLTENVLFRLPRPALVEVAQLFADMFSIPFLPGDDVDGRTDDRPIILHGISAVGLRQAMQYHIYGPKGEFDVGAWLHALVFAHRTGAYALYEKAALLFSKYFITSEPPWAPRHSYCNQNHEQPRCELSFGMRQCYDTRYCIKQLPSYSHPDDKQEPDRTSSVGDAFYPCLDDDPGEVNWGWYSDHFEGPKGDRAIPAPDAVALLATALELGIDVRFFPGALASVLDNKTSLTPTAVAKLTKRDEGSTEIIADCVLRCRNEDAVEESDETGMRLGKGTQLVNSLYRAKRLWEYCTRNKGEATWGMLNTVVRTVWDAPDENAEGWVFMCEKP